MMINIGIVALGFQGDEVLALFNTIKAPFDLDRDENTHRSIAHLARADMINALPSDELTGIMCLIVMIGIDVGSNDDECRDEIIANMIAGAGAGTAYSFRWEDLERIRVKIYPTGAIEAGRVLH